MSSVNSLGSGRRKAAHHVEELDLKDESRLRRHGPGATLAIPEVRRYDESPHPALPHPDEAHVPSAYHLRRTERKVNRLAAIVVKLAEASRFMIGAQPSVLACQLRATLSSTSTAGLRVDNLSSRSALARL